MNIEEIKERLKATYEEGDSIDYIYIDLIDFIESQQKTIEDMKCCGNCKNYMFGCIKDFEACSGKHLLWESKQ